jgi:hypothetical protein
MRKIKELGFPQSSDVTDFQTGESAIPARGQRGLKK